MTKSEKIHNYQTALNCLRHVENIFDKLNNNFPSKIGLTYKHFLLTRDNVSVIRDKLLEDFINDTFTDCDSDCATVPAIVPATATATAPTAQPAAGANSVGYRPQYRRAVPVVLTKDGKSQLFPSCADAGRFLVDKFGGWYGDYAALIRNYLRIADYPLPQKLHGYTPSYPNN